MFFAYNGEWYIITYSAKVRIFVYVVVSDDSITIYGDKEVKDDENDFSAEEKTAFQGAWFS